MFQNGVLDVRKPQVDPEDEGAVEEMELADDEEVAGRKNDYSSSNAFAQRGQDSCLPHTWPQLMWFECHFCCPIQQVSQHREQEILVLWGVCITA